MTIEQRARKIASELALEHYAIPKTAVTLADAFFIVRAEALEDAARLVEQNIEVVIQGGENRRYLSPRKHGNLASLAYADEIRALKS